MTIKNVLFQAILCLISFQNVLQGQDTIYYDRHFNVLGSPKGAYLLTISRANPQTPGACTRYSMLTDSNRMVSIIKYSNCAANLRDGKTSIWYTGTNKLKAEIQYARGQKQGPEKLYYPNGQLKRLLTFDHDSIVSGQFFNEDGSIDTEIYQEDTEPVSQVEPSFPGGLGAMYKFLFENVNYPESAKENGWAGKVVCSFVIDKTGKVTDVKVEQAPYPVLGQAVAKAIADMPYWNSGMDDGMPVRVRYFLPFTFRLE